MRGLRKVLIVDGDAALRRALAEQLDLHGEFRSRECDSGAAALEILRHERFDAVLLDAALPDTGGNELCRRLRSVGVDAPILMLFAADGEVDRAAALAAGADDCLVRPLRLNALLAQLRAHLRSDERGARALTIGPYVFVPSAKLLTDASGRRQVRLTEKETAILEFLYRAGTTIGREALLGEVWGYNAGVTTHTLETHVYRLRRKIERDPARAELLVTEPGGYRLLP